MESGQKRKVFFAFQDVVCGGIYIPQFQLYSLIKEGTELDSYLHYNTSALEIRWD